MRADITDQGDLKGPCLLCSCCSCCREDRKLLCSCPLLLPCPYKPYELCGGCPCMCGGCQVARRASSDPMGCELKPCPLL